MVSRLFSRKARWLTHRPVLEALEDRIVLDAAVDATPQDQHDSAGQTQADAAAGASAAPATASGNGEAAAGGGQGAGQTDTDSAHDVVHQNLNVILISNHLDQVDAISAAAEPDAKVIVYDASDGNLSEVIAKLQAEVASTGEQIGHLAWFSHGDPGVLKVGDNLMFSAETVTSNPQAWQDLGSLMAQNARIDLYGCDIGQGTDGMSLVSAIAQTTGTVVWASDDTTGSGTDADWDLEVKSGESSLTAVVDVAALESHAITLDNSDLTNAGFETGTTTGWTAVNDVHVVSASTGGVHGSNGYEGQIDVGASPYASEGSQYMVRLDSQTSAGNDLYHNPALSDLSNYSLIEQQFTYGGTDSLVFAYAVATTDGSQYGHYDEFGYEVVVNGVTQINYTINSGDVPPDVWQTPRESGWREVNIDLSNYADSGDTVTLRIWAGDSIDNIWDTWAFVDMPTTSSYHLPTADPASVTVARDGSVTFDVIGYDPDSHAVGSVHFDVDSDYGPTHGTLISVGGAQYDATNHYYYQTYTYTPDPGYWGEDNFLFTFSTPSGSWKGFISNTGWPVGARGETSSTYDLALTDLNHDGLSDLVTANSNGSSGGNQPDLFYLGDPNTFFRDGVTMDTYAGGSGDSVSLAVGDLNNDGFEDVVVRNGQNGYDMVYLWDSANQVFNPVSQLSGTNSGTNGAVALGDFDRDGDLDVVVASGNNNAAEVIHWNNGDGTFAAATTSLPSVNGTTSVIETADFNGDGYVDIFVGKSSNNNAAILYNDGYGGFSTAHRQYIGVSRVSSADVGDVDGDGWVDLVLGRGGGSNRTNYYVHNNADDDGSLDGNGHAKWDTPTTITGDSRDTRGIALADVDRDGDLDVFVADYNSTLKLYEFYGGSFHAATNISSGNLSALSITAGDVDGDGDIDCVVGIAGGNNLYFQNSGFHSGSSPMRHGDPAEVTIHVEPIYNWSFENTADHYDGWTLTETYADTTLPANIQDEFGTFAIIHNQPEGTVINWDDLLHDYYDNNEQNQYSIHTLTYPGSNGITIDGSSTDYTAVLLSGGERTAVLTQTVSLDQDVYLEKLELSWDLSYWNTNLGEDPGSEFNADQFLAVYIYDSSGTQLSVWTSTNGVDQAVVGSMQHYTVKMDASDALVTALKTGPTDIVIELEVHGMEWYLDAAIDDFTLVPTRHYPAFLVNPVAMAAFTSSPTLDAVVGASALAAPLSDPGLATLNASFQTTSASAPPLTSLSVLTDLAQNETSPLVLSTGSLADGTTDSTLLLLRNSSPGTTMTGPEDLLQSLDASVFAAVAGEPSAAASAGSRVADPFYVASAEVPISALETVVEAPGEIVVAGDFATVDGLSGSAPDGHGRVIDSSAGVVFNLSELDVWQAIMADTPALTDAAPTSPGTTVAEQLSVGGSIAVSLDSLSFLDLLG